MFWDFENLQGRHSKQSWSAPKLNSTSFGFLKTSPHFPSLCFTEHMLVTFGVTWSVIITSDFLQSFLVIISKNLKKYQIFFSEKNFSVKFLWIFPHDLKPKSKLHFEIFQWKLKDAPIKKWKLTFEMTISLARISECGSYNPVLSLGSQLFV